MTQTLTSVESMKAMFDPYAAGPAVFARLARGNAAAISPEDDIVMRWHGLYRHRPLESERFMLRVRLPNGDITVPQLRVLAELAQRTGHPYVNLTTRQDIQVYGLSLADLPDVFMTLETAGLTSLGACGDVVRNVVGCSAAGLDARETLDITPTVQALTAAFLGNSTFANLPRKFKIAVSGCADGCVPVRINDVGLVVASNAEGAPGYALFVGGGLSTAPVLAAPMLAWVAPDEVVEVVTRLVEIFREYGNRAQRTRARLKHVLAERGAAWLREELITRLGRPLLPAPQLTFGGHTDHLGVHPRREADRAYIGIPVPAGRLRVEQLAALAVLIAGNMRVTHHQNLLLTDVPNATVPAVLAELAALGLPVEANGWSGRLVVCPGKTVCLKALVHTKEVAESLLNALAVLPHAPVSLHLSGCPNGCGQHAIAEIGLQGALTGVGEARRECFDLWIGGGEDAFARRILARVVPDALPETIDALLTRFHAEAISGESFSAFARRALWTAPVERAGG